MADTILELKQVVKRYGDLEILRGINLSLLEGESIAVMGPSGVGKSTLLHIAGLMDRPTIGSVIINGEKAGPFTDERLAKERLDTIGFLFQFHYLLPEFNVLDNVLIPARLAEDDFTKIRQEAVQLLTELKLDHRLEHFPNQLSGGEQQRTALARALIRRPKLLLLDEPTGNLDHETSVAVMGLIWDQIKARRLAAIVVTHNILIAEQATRIFRMMDGRFLN